MVTDGYNTAGTIAPAEAARLAKELGVKIHTIGIGKKHRGLFDGIGVVTSPKKEFDEKTLKEMAAITGGRYFSANDTEELKSVYKEIDQLEERVEETFQYIDYEEQYFPFAASGFVLFLAATMLSSTILLKIP